MIESESICFCGQIFEESPTKDSCVRAHYKESHSELFLALKEITANYEPAPYHCRGCYPGEYEEIDSSERELHMLQYHSHILKEINTDCRKYFRKGK